MPISPCKGTLAITVLVAENLFRCKAMPSTDYLDTVRSDNTNSIVVATNLQQEKNCNFLLGSSRQFVGFDSIVDLNVISMVLSRTLRFFPFIARITVLRAWVGFRLSSPDLLPIILPVESIDGMYIAARHEGIGITETPIKGKLISQLITGQQPEIPSDELMLSRCQQVV